MIKEVMKVFGEFSRRMQKDHMGAYAATCAYFLMISFVPFIMIFIAFAQRTNADISAVIEGIMSAVPSGLKDYVNTIVNEVTAKTYTYVPLSLFILIWSAAKFFHALANGLNVISKVPETRGWFYLRFRSMLYVILLLLVVGGSLVLSMFGPDLMAFIEKTAPLPAEIIQFVISFRALFMYAVFILLFLFLYTFLPNCHYSFRSQFPGALIVSTVWVFFSYLMTLYYEHNQNFNDIYGSLTGVVLAMIWLYFCCYFILFGAELNRVLYEDPEDNIIVSTIGAVKDASVKKQQIIANELDEHSVWKPIYDEDVELPSFQPEDIDIPWADEEEDEETDDS